MKKDSFYIVEVKFNNINNLDQFNEEVILLFNIDGIEEFTVDEQEIDEIFQEDACTRRGVPQEILDNIEKIKEKEGIAYKYYFFTEEAEGAYQFSDYLKEKEIVLENKIYKKECLDWNAEWKKHYAPIKITDEIIIIPEWYKKDGHKNIKSNIYINPGMGFGTGEHETTYLCLILFTKIKEHLKEKALCLDFGCGSGILGISGIKKNNLIVDFIDIDPMVLDNCYQNLLLNFEEEKLQGHALVKRDRFIFEKKYKIIFSNILEYVLINEKENILNSLDQDGLLIL